MDSTTLLTGLFVILGIIFGLTCHIFTSKCLAKEIAADRQRRAEEERLREQQEAQKKGIPASVLAGLPTMTLAQAREQATLVAAPSGDVQQHGVTDSGDVEEGGKVKDLNEREPNESTSECVVCLAEFSQDEMVKKLPPCGHWFHPNCIDQWLTTQSTCPVCRLDMKKALGLNDVPEEKKEEAAPGNEGNDSHHVTATAEQDRPMRLEHVCVDVDPSDGAQEEADGSCTGVASCEEGSALRAPMMALAKGKGKVAKQGCEVCR